MLMQKAQESGECLAGSCSPKLCAEKLTAGYHGSQYVESLASLCFNKVPAPTWRPCAAVGVDLGEAHFIDIGQRDLTVCGPTPKMLDLDLRCSEGGFITFFLESGVYASRSCRMPSTLPSRCQPAPADHRPEHARPATEWRTAALPLHNPPKLSSCLI